MALTHRFTARTAKQTIKQFYTVTLRDHSQQIMDNSYSEEDFEDQLAGWWSYTADVMRQCGMRENIWHLETIVNDYKQWLLNEMPTRE